MTTFLLVLTIFSASVETGQNIGVVMHAIKAVHHHTTRPMYRHVIKPVAKVLNEKVIP